MDIRELYPKDIIKEENMLYKIYMSGTGDSVPGDWDDFCGKYASKRYLGWLSAKRRQEQDDEKKGIIRN